MSNDTVPVERFAIRNLTAMAFTNGFTQWVYKDRHNTADQCCSPGFFYEASDMLAPGDMIIITARDGVRMVSVKVADVETVIVQGMV